MTVRGDAERAVFGVRRTGRQRRIRRCVIGAQGEIRKRDARGLRILANEIGMVGVGVEYEGACMVCQLTLAIQIVFEGEVFDVADVVGGD